LSRRDKRQERKWAKLENETKEFNKGVNFVNVDEEERKQKEKDTQKAMKDAAAWSTKIGMDTPEWWDNGTVEAALPEGLSPEDIEMINASNADRENMLKKQRVLETYLNPDSPLLLNNSDKGDFIENWYLPTLKNAEYIREEFKPSLDVIDPGLGERYKFSTGKSKATQAEEDALKEAQEQEEADQFEEDMIRGKRGYKYGGLPKAQIGVKSPTNGINPASDPTASLGPIQPSTGIPGLPKSFQSLSGAVEAVGESPVSDNKEDDDLIAQDVETRRKFNGVNFNNKLNMGLDAFTGAMRGLDQAKQQNEMYANNFNADSLYGASTNKDKGDYVAYGQQTGMFRPNETGQETMGRFAYGQSGGYMQEGGYTEGDEVDMTEEELAEFIANGGEVEYL
jgi:hypothetical protein